MDDLLLHDATRSRLESFLRQPTHALMLTGQSGSGKRSLARTLGAQLVGKPDITTYPYAKILAPEEGKALGIETVRELEHFLSLKVPHTRDTNRIVIIENAHTLGHEAQNALLKTLEEPPQSTVLILTVTHPQSLLPTIRSRVQAVPLQPPTRQQVEAHFPEFKPAAVAQAYAISGGLPGLMHALLANEDHPLLQATQLARQLLQQSSYERLLQVDTIAKNRDLAINVTAILQQMAHVRLQSAEAAAAKRWQAVLASSYEAAEALLASAQPKLVLSRLMLSL